MPEMRLICKDSRRGCFVGGVIQTEYNKECKFNKVTGVCRGIRYNSRNTHNLIWDYSSFRLRTIKLEEVV